MPKDLVMEGDDSKNNDQSEGMTPWEDDNSNIGDYENPLPIIRKRYVLDSDSDDQKIDEQRYEQGTKSRKSTLIDSENECGNQGVDNIIFNSKGRLLQENSSSQNKSNLEGLYDLESEDEFISEGEKESLQQLSQQNFSEKQKIPKFKGKSKSTLKRGKAKSQKLKRMTPKEAAEIRKEILSESQRMIREKNVALPYHKPRSHNIKEFLSQRPKLAITVPLSIAAPPSVAIKMSTEQLAVISEKLKEREKKLKNFYKSDSDSEDKSTDEDYLPPAIDSFIQKENGSLQEPQDEQSVSISEDLEHVIIKPSSTDTDPNAHAAIPLGEKESGTQIVFNILPENDERSKHNQEPNTNEVDEKTIYTESEIVGSQEGQSSLEFNGFEHTTNDGEPNSLTYNFNLDDLQQHTESISNCDSLTESDKRDDLEIRTGDKFVFTHLNNKTENFHKHENSNELCNLVPKSKLELLNEKVQNIKPKLSGQPDELIDLNLNGSKPSEVVQLMQRFAKHVSSKKENHKHKVHLSIVTVESGGDIHKETVAMNVDDGNNPEIEQKPGAKLKKLRQELQSQMAQRKSIIWQQKSSKDISSALNQLSQDKKEGYEEELPFDDEEEILTESEDSEEEIEDVCIKDKPSKKSVFLDEEAEESGIEEIDHEVEHDEDEAIDELTDQNCDIIDDNSNFATKSVDDEINCGEKKSLKRILNTFEDSDDDENSVANRDTIGVDNDDDDDDVIPPNQPQSHTTPVRQPTSQQKSAFDFLTPISFLTGLQSLNSASKSAKASPILISPFRINQYSPTKDSAFSTSQKKLFLDEDTASSPTTPVALKEPYADESNEVCTQDLLNICSGQFTGVTQLESSAKVDRDDIELSKPEEIKLLGDDQDFLISQLLDEKKIENFKKKFNSPTDRINSEDKCFSDMHRTADENTQKNAKETVGGGIIDSDDENEDEIEIKVRTNKKQIVYSDEESADENPEEDEEIELADVDEMDDVAPDDINYDSEENEIDSSRQQKIKMTDFLEDEAELTESDWGSEDEDEQDLDRLEFEEGDMEKFDEDTVRENLEKIHMRRLLDDDTREVKILQELLLEDGELHGTGRQRQFKWKNVNDANDGEENKVDDDIFMEEEESEEQWRKKRHEREMFLKEQKQKSSATEGLMQNSELLKIGHKVLQKSQSQNNSLNIENSDATTASPVLKQFSLFHKRGSFLSRGDQVLQKVAEYSKVTAVLGFGASKTTKNFIFQKMSATGDMVEKKRKAPEGTPNVIKRMRLSDLSPALKKKSSNIKKLFNDM
ncbi:claspin [Cylas formicarius]|uniref:claspin n=1 Tax=Cylas formicarius TaxID=197179 RepID=UPI002958C632|nr:claspin [Cylas formicarius]